VETPRPEDLLGAEELGPGAEFRVRNDSDVPIWVGAVGECFGDPAFKLLDDTSTEVDHLGNCFEPLCDWVVDSIECGIGCPDCGVASAIRLAPGAEGTLNWSGRQLTSVDFPPECGPEGCTETCAVQDQAPAGTYTVELDVYTSCEGECECLDGDEFEGLCRLFDAVELTGTPDVRSAQFDYPAQTEVQVVFEF
jgi:hypothetical protein